MNLCLTILSLASLLFPFYGESPKRFETAGENKQAQTDKPPMFVLQIGISNYKYVRKLSGVTDVLEMRKLLTDAATYNVPRENIVTLCDDGSVKECDGAATKENIVRQFENHLVARARDYRKKTGKSALVVFEFSGHGSQVKDADGDETDGLDETLVTWDSNHDAGGVNLDITDDEIYKLNNRLSAATDNIVFILDSCTSGSGTRGAENADGVRGVPMSANRVTAAKSFPVEAGTRGEQQKAAPDEKETDMLPPSGNYIVLSAAKAGQLAKQKDVFECETCQKKIASFGNLTFYLMNELRNATENTSYRDMMDNIRREVSTATRDTQTPQIEGDDNRFVFAKLSRVKEAGIAISKADDKQITINAGLMQGVTTGTIVNIYGGADNEKIGVARVSRVVSPGQSVADIITQKRAVDVGKKDRAVLIAPDLGTMRLKILIDGDDAAKLAADGNYRKIVETLRRRFTPVAPEKVESRGVDLAAGKWNDTAARWDVALLKDSFDKVFKDRSLAAPVVDREKSTDRKPVFKPLPAVDKQVFYLAGKDFVPLYGFFVEAEAGDNDAANERIAGAAADNIEDAFVHISRLRSVKAIVNNRSPLRGLVKITPFELVGASCSSQKLVAAKSIVPLPLNKSKTAYPIAENTIFGFEIVNNSKSDVYITLLDIGNDGAVHILSPRNTDEEKDGVKLAAGEKKQIYGDGCKAWTTSAPTGVETFKVIASTAQTTRADFEFLQMDAIGGRRGEEKKLAGLPDWTTAEIDFEISSAPKNP